MKIERPAVDWELARLLSDASQNGTPVAVIGGGSKQHVGRPMPDIPFVSTHVLRGVTQYKPADLTISAQAGTPLADIERELAGNGQMLACEPLDLGPALGRPARQTTVGGMVASNLAGSRGVQGGALQSHLLGLHAVTGGGEMFRCGGPFLTSPEGFDFCRALCGSWGTLAVVLEATFQVVPEPEHTATLIVLGLSDEIAVEALCLAMAQPVPVSGAVHLSEALGQRLEHSGLRETGVSVTAFRLETFEAFAADRMARLRHAMAHFGEAHVLEADDSRLFWGELRQLSIFQQNSEAPLWRIVTQPCTAAAVVSGIQRYMPAQAYYDWGGRVVWLEVPPAADAGATDIRRVLSSFGGYASLIRAPAAVREEVEVFHPVDPGFARIARAMKAAFDPAGILNPGRLYADL